MYAYVNEHIYVASGRPPGTLGGPCLVFRSFLGNFVLIRFGRATSEVRHLLLDVTSSTAP